MQEHDWDDLKYLLALHRTGRLSAAALKTGANETTVSRRIKRLEAALGGELVRRDSGGRFELTGLGETLLPLAEETERAQTTIREVADRDRGVTAGTVRITSVPIIVNRILLPHLAGFRRAHPEITIDLVPEARRLDLGRQEADLALRFARPENGGHAIRGQKLGTLRFGNYVPADVRDGGRLGWVGYDGMSAALPQADWTRALAEGEIAFTVSDAETALESVAHGLGKACLPVRAAENDNRLRRLAGPEPAPTREVWLLSRAGDDERQSLTLAKAWLAGLPWD